MSEFLSQDEVNSILRGCNPTPTWYSDTEWAEAMLATDKDYPDVTHRWDQNKSYSRSDSMTDIRDMMEALYTELEDLRRYKRYMQGLFNYDPSVNMDEIATDIFLKDR